VYEQLGIGGMAQVHRAELVGTEGFHRPVALKRMLPHVAANVDMVKSFVREAHLASYLHHANIGQTYELGKVEDIYFIAMELIVGRNLREILRHCAQTTGPMPVPVALNVIQQICDALDYAHNLCDERGKPLGIIHRDVSPSNIIVAEGGVVKLIDFGIAKVSSAAMQTMSGTIKGKFGYMAPEYLEGRIDARADLFAVGVIAHELLTNRPLFTTPDDMETLKRVRSMTVVPPSMGNPHVPPEVDDLVMTALARDPDARWQHATALRNAMTTITARTNLVISNSRAADWVEWAFEQTKPRGHSALRTIVLADDDPSIAVEVASLTSQFTNIKVGFPDPPIDTPVGTPQKITAQRSIPPGSQQAFGSQPPVDPPDPGRHHALVPNTGRMSDDLIPTAVRESSPSIDRPVDRSSRQSAPNMTLAGTAAPMLRNPPSSSNPPYVVSRTITPQNAPYPSSSPRIAPPPSNPPYPSSSPRIAPPSSGPYSVPPPPVSSPQIVPPPAEGVPTKLERPMPGSNLPRVPVTPPAQRRSPVTVEPPQPPTAQRLRDSAPTFDPPFVHGGRAPELPTVQAPAPSTPRRSSGLLTVVLVLLVAAIAAAAVYFLLPLLT
jgi:serine/threonine protein kinase